MLSTMVPDAQCANEGPYGQIRPYRFGGTPMGEGVTESVSSPFLIAPIVIKVVVSLTSKFLLIFYKQ